MKDAAATAIYGSKAANGVIVIETKAPEAGVLRVAYGGEIRIEVPDLSDYNLLNAREKLEVEKLAGYYDEEVLKAKFGALYNAFQFGAPPHAGMAPGVDRMIMLLRNEENIREIIPFPMSGTAQDLMCGAPNEVTEQQLREVHIKVRD